MTGGVSLARRGKRVWARSKPSPLMHTLARSFRAWLRKLTRRDRAVELGLPRWRSDTTNIRSSVATVRISSKALGVVLDREQVRCAGRLGKGRVQISNPSGELLQHLDGECRIAADAEQERSRAQLHQHRRLDGDDVGRAR